jgi:hypothetical protein
LYHGTGSIAFAEEYDFNCEIVAVPVVRIWLVKCYVCIVDRWGVKKARGGEQHEAGLLKEGGGKFLWIEKTSKKENE